MIWESSCHPVNFRGLWGHWVYSDPWTPQTLHSLENEKEGCPWWLSGKVSSCQNRRPGFDSWVRKIPWWKKRQPTPVFLPGKSHGQRSLAAYIYWVTRVGHNWTQTLSYGREYILVNWSFKGVWVFNIVPSAWMALYHNIQKHPLQKQCKKKAEHA